MYSIEDQAFVTYWENNRERQKKWRNQLTIGLPFGLGIGIPVLISFLFRGWYKQMPFIEPGEFLLILIAVFAIIVFYAIFTIRHRWEMNEQHYLEIKARENYPGVSVTDVTI